MSTLTLEVLAAFTVRQYGQVTTWHPGKRVTLSPDKAQRVIERVGNKVRVVTSTRVGSDLTGQIVTWESPWLWGEMRATVLEDLGHGVQVVHPVTAVTCVIPMTWLRREQ
jgi:hypothetical protein